MRSRVLVIPFLAMLPAAAQEPAQLSVESLFHPVRKEAYVAPLPVMLHWRPDGSLVAERVDRDPQAGLSRLAPPAWESRPLLNRAQFMAALAGAGLDEAGAGAAWRGPFIWNERKDAFLVTARRDFYLVELAGKASARRVTSSPDAKEAARFSPDGTQLAYLCGNDLRVTDLATGKETQLTSGGGDERLNGRLDWLYREEVFPGNGPGAFWWSPDSRRIAFLSLDETDVPSYTLLDDRSQHRELVSTPYPRPGEPNPTAHLGVAELDGRVAWMEDPYPEEETLIVQVGWDPQGRLVANYQDRTQTWLECVRFEDGKGRALVREDSRGWWTDRLPLPTFLTDGFLWLSARTGFHHLYRYDAQGRGGSPLTAGAWDVRRLQGVDERTRRIYFEATQRNPIGLDAYVADLDAQAPNQNMARLTEKPGTHAVVHNPAFTVAVDRFSDVDTPPQQLLLNAEGRVLLQEDSRTSKAFKALRRGRVSFQQITTRDGVALETMLVLPPDFDPARKYPVFHYVYGGPGLPAVRNAFDPQGLWYQFLAQQGIVTWICDNRSASAKGTASAQGVYRRLGVQELQDQLDGLAWLKAQGWADMNRIALCGTSYGGFLAAYALTHSKAWKLGILGAPVVDWRLYDSVYTERYMGLPDENPDGYAASSPLRAAASLSGKVLLIHGTLDENVHLQHTVLFLDALQKAGQNAPLVLLPGAGHQLRAPQHLWAMYQSIWDFLQKNL